MKVRLLFLTNAVFRPALKVVRVFNEEECAKRFDFFFHAFCSRFLNDFRFSSLFGRSKL